MTKAFDLEHYRKTKQIKKVDIAIQKEQHPEFDDLEKMHAVA